MIAGDEVGPLGCSWIVAAETSIPDAVVVGDKSIGDVRIADDESCFFDDGYSC